MILDIHLPYAFGADILAEIRDRCPKAVIAIATADIVNAKKLTGKADHVLLKPISLVKLLKLAESVKGAP